MVFWQLLILSFAIGSFGGFLAIKYKHKHFDSGDFEVWRERLLARDPEIEIRLSRAWYEKHPQGVFFGEWLKEKYLKRFDDGIITSVILLIISSIIGTLASIW